MIMIPYMLHVLLYLVMSSSRPRPNAVVLYGPQESFTLNLPLDEKRKKLRYQISGIRTGPNLEHRTGPESSKIRTVPDRNRPEETGPVHTGPYRTIPGQNGPDRATYLYVCIGPDLARASDQTRASGAGPARGLVRCAFL